MADMDPAPSPAPAAPPPPAPVVEDPAPAPAPVPLLEVPDAAAANAAAKRRVGRIATKGRGLAPGSRATSEAASTPPPPGSPKLDPLTSKELELFGNTSVKESLPHPPNGIPGLPVPPAIPQKRSLDSGLSADQPGRPKRPKNVKFSCARVGREPAKRALAAAAEGAPLPDIDVLLPNHDWCDSCGGKGDFVCCDGGCLRSFHLSCLNPPVELDEVEDAWFCNECSFQRHPSRQPPRGIFSHLLWKIEGENPKSFSLPTDMRNYFADVVTGASGEYMDTNEQKKPVVGRATAQEERGDGYKLKDKNNRPVLCYRCHQAASFTQQRRILSCDFCEQHWHLDCLDPPMTGMPPAGRKWMCPLHADPLLPRKRLNKQTTTVTVKDRMVPNNGDIIIIPRPDEGRSADGYDEVVLNRIRYQVPEDTIVTDFWARLQGETPKLSMLKPTMRKHLFEAHKFFDRKMPTMPRPPSSSSSPLTPIDDLSDGDHAGAAGRQANGHTFYGISANGIGYDTSRLDDLATQAARILSNGRGYQSYVGGRPVWIENQSEMMGGARRYRAGEATRSSLHKDSIKKRFMHPSGSRRSGAVAGRSQLGGRPLFPGEKELEVSSREDLKALVHVRKLLQEMGGKSGDPAQQHAVFDFIAGAQVVPKLAFLDQKPVQRPPWTHPWEGGSTSSDGAPSRVTTSSSTAQAGPSSAAPNGAAPTASGADANDMDIDR